MRKRNAIRLEYSKMKLHFINDFNQEQRLNSFVIFVCTLRDFFTLLKYKSLKSILSVFF